MLRPFSNIVHALARVRSRRRRARYALLSGRAAAIFALRCSTGRVCGRATAPRFGSLGLWLAAMPLSRALTSRGPLLVSRARATAQGRLIEGARPRLLLCLRCTIGSNDVTMAPRYQYFFLIITLLRVLQKDKCRI